MAQQFPIGSQIGSYRLVKQLGVGGMGTVYQAEHVVLGRAAALTIIHPALLERSQYRQRFINEARAVNAIKHANIVDIYDVGEENGVVYYVMELLVGCSLAELLNERRRLDLGEALAIAAQVASALEA